MYYAEITGELSCLEYFPELYVVKSHAYCNRSIK